MPHPFDNPYTEPESLPTEGMPTFEQFQLWCRRNNLSFGYSNTDMQLVYNDPSFRTNQIWAPARREMLVLRDV